jgi:predicted MFS family arabinose efflux permease
VLTFGSLVGTVVYGLWVRPVAHRTQLPILTGLLAGMLVGAAFSPGLVVLTAWVAGAGLLLGPISVRCFTDVEHHTPNGTLAAASTTLIATGLAATSAGIALAGWLIDLNGATTALLAAASFMVLVGVLLVRRSEPEPLQQTGDPCHPDRMSPTNSW